MPDLILTAEANAHVISNTGVTVTVYMKQHGLVKEYFTGPVLELFLGYMEGTKGSGH